MGVFAKIIAYENLIHTESFDEFEKNVNTQIHTKCIQQKE
jgi:hypothetical protein